MATAGSGSSGGAQVGSGSGPVAGASQLIATWDPQLIITYSYNGDGTGYTPSRLQVGAQIPSFRRQLGSGSGPGLASKRFAGTLNFGPGNTDFDLLHVPDLLFNQTIAFSLLKWFILRLRTPAAGQRLLIGNYGSEGWVGWLGGNLQAHEVRDQCEEFNQIDGWTVDGTHRYLRINNPGGAGVTADLILLGE